jgi:pimeloyl-ACP methyl ester carboxylesterase
MVCLHGFMDTWRVWELVLPALEREHDVLAPTLPGHAGGPPVPPGAGAAALADAVEAAMDAAGMATAHLVGNSLGGWLALELAARGRARSVVALAPAGGWARGDALAQEVLSRQEEVHAAARRAAPQAEALLASVEGRRLATRDIVTRFEHLPPELLAHQLARRGGRAGAGSSSTRRGGRAGPWTPSGSRVPVRILWGTEDRLLPWPRAAERLRRALPHADWIELDGVGHCPQLDVPLETPSSSSASPRAERAGPQSSSSSTSRSGSFSATRARPPCS